MLKPHSHVLLDGAQILWRAIFGNIEDVAKIQFIRICLASTSFTIVRVEQKLWKFAEVDLPGKWS